MTNRYLLVPFAAMELLRARLLLAVRSERETLELIGLGVDASSSQELDAADFVWLENLRWALGGVANRMPFRADCLVRVIAGDRMLRRHGLRGRTSLQVGRLPDGGFEAHAWLECGGKHVAGGGPNVGFVSVDPSRLTGASGTVDSLTD